MSSVPKINTAVKVITCRTRDSALPAMLEAAVAWAARNLDVFPCEKKIPLTGSGGFKNATCDAKQILQWWTRWPDAQIGMPTGAVNHLFVLDIDGPAGDAAVERMELPETFTVETRPGRRQLWFYQPSGIVTRCTAGVLARQLDTRGDGGYTIAPPSIHHETGKPYRIVRDVAWAETPDALINLLRTQEAPAADSGAIPKGKRHQTLLSMAGALRARGLSGANVLATLRVLNHQQCQPPIEDADLQRLAAFVGGKPAGAPARLAETSAEVETECFADIPVESLRWLWDQRIPAGKLTIFAGDPGQGKSLATIDIAARVSRGDVFPDGCRAGTGDSIILSCEDDARDTIAPRLRAARAVVARIHRVKAVRVTLADGATGESTFNFERDMEKLDVALGRIPNVKLLIVDPLSAYMGHVDTHRDAEIRRVLAPLADLAARRHLAVIGIMHLKKSETSALLRVSGSIAFVAAARAVWVFGEDPDAPENRVMVPAKNNLAARGSGLAYRVEAEPGAAPRITWLDGTVSLTANDVAVSDPRERNAGGTRGDRKEAIAWLRAQLADGPLLATELQRRADDSGLSWATIRRAKDRLPIEARKTSVTGGWCWELRS